VKEKKNTHKDLEIWKEERGLESDMCYELEDDFESKAGDK